MSKQMVFIFFAALIMIVFGCPCPRNYFPICDNEGNQHNNLCLFECAAKKALRSGKGLYFIIDF